MITECRHVGWGGGGEREREGRELKHAVFGLFKCE